MPMKLCKLLFPAHKAKSTILFLQYFVNMNIIAPAYIDFVAACSTPARDFAVQLAELQPNL